MIFTAVQEHFREYDSRVSADEKNIHEQLIMSSWSGLLNAFVILLEASTDEAVTESILESLQVIRNFTLVEHLSRKFSLQKMSSLSGILNSNNPRDAFIIAICKSCLPPYYNLSILNANNGNNQETLKNLSNKPQGSGQQQFYDSEVSSILIQVLQKGSNGCFSRCAIK